MTATSVKIRKIRAESGVGAPDRAAQEDHGVLWVNGFTSDTLDDRPLSLVRTGSSFAPLRPLPDATGNSIADPLRLPRIDG